MLELAHQQVLSPAHILMRPAFSRLAGGLLGKLMALGYRLTGKAQYDAYLLERVNGVPILVIPSVCNPKSMRTGAFLASQLDATLVGGDAEILDMGTGSGICAVFCASHCHRVVAVDINEAAVRCAKINAGLNHLEEKIEVRHGDLFAPVAAERFDLVLFNPPFFRGAPRNDRDRAWRSNDVAERFAAGLSAHLKPGGSALVLLSSFGDAAGFLEEFSRHDFAIALFAQRHFVNERLAIFKLTPRHSPSVR
ncbi:MAG TPA: methyltransferase [Steroidobacteraceae bacterium]